MLKSILKTHVEGEEEPQGSLMPGKLTGWLASLRGAQLLPACPSKTPFEPPVPYKFLTGKGVARGEGELGRTGVSGRKDDAELALGRVLLMLASCGAHCRWLVPLGSTGGGVHLSKHGSPGAPCRPLV